MTETTPRKPPAPISCSGCPATWTALGAAHCSACHRTFSSAGLFDRHRSAAGGEHGSCLDPGRLVTARTGDPVAVFRDGMWRGPEMTDEAKTKRFGPPPRDPAGPLDTDRDDPEAADRPDEFDYSTDPTRKPPRDLLEELTQSIRRRTESKEATDART